MGKARETLDRYLGYAADETENGLSWESPLSVETNGKYVDVLFQTGGPHFDVQFEYDDAEAAEFWYENEPTGAVAHFADWGESDWCGVNADDAGRLVDAINRDPSTLGEGDDQ